MTLAEFFLRLATDQELLARFSADPDTTGRDLGLTEEQLGLVRSGKLKEIRVKVEVDIQIGDETVMIHTVHTGTVHWTPPPSGE